MLVVSRRADDLSQKCAEAEKNSPLPATISRAAVSNLVADAYQKHWLRQESGSPEELMTQRQQFEEEESATPYVREGGSFMEDVPGHGSAARRNEDIALDMMKFIAMTTGYGKTGTPGAGFQGGPPAKPTEYAEHLLELYGRCLGAVQGKK